MILVADANPCWARVGNLFLLKLKLNIQRAVFLKIAVSTRLRERQVSFTKIHPKQCAIDLSIQEVALMSTKMIKSPVRVKKNLQNDVSQAESRVAY